MIFQENLLHAWQFWHLDFAGEEHLHPLDLGQVLPVCQEQLHVIVVLELQEVFKAVLHSELLSFVCEEADIYYRKKIFSFFDLDWASIDNDEILLSHWPEFESNSLRKLPWNRVFDEPGFVNVLAVLDEVAFGLIVWLFQIFKVEWKRVIVISNGFFFRSILSFS